jgi:hypothetical protein
MSILHVEHGLELYIMEVFAIMNMTLNDIKIYEYYILEYLFLGTIYFAKNKLESFELCTCWCSISLSLMQLLFKYVTIFQGHFSLKLRVL